MAGVSINDIVDMAIEGVANERGVYSYFNVLVVREHLNKVLVNEEWKKLGSIEKHDIIVESFKRLVKQKKLMPGVKCKGYMIYCKNEPGKFVPKTIKDIERWTNAT